MKMEVFVLFLILVHVSHHALAVVVQAYEGEQSILLPYKYFDHHFAVPDEPIVSWNWSGFGLDLIIHRRKDDGDDLKKQNERYRGRTSMAAKALDSGDFSLTLQNPQMSDSGNYTCAIWTGLTWLRLTEIQLQVKDDQVVVEVQVGAESVRLPCETSPHLPEDTRVEWTHLDPVKMLVQTVRVYQNTSSDRRRHTAWGHTEMNKDLLKSGNLSLTMKHPRERDTGIYICTFYVKGDTRKQKIVLHHVQLQRDHHGHFPKWATGLLIFLLLVVIFNTGYLLFLFRPQITSDRMEIESGEEFVQLLCEAPSNVTEHAFRAKWTNDGNDIIYMYKRGCDVSEIPVCWFYRLRAQVNDDFSLTLKYPTDQDNYTYTCTIYNRDDEILLTKQVALKVKVCEVEVEEGEESVLLPFRTTQDLPKDTEVKWFHHSNNARKSVYEYKKDSAKQYEMSENPLESGDLSLILKDPKVTNNGKYRCHVRLNGAALTKKTVRLNVKGRSQRVDMSSRSSSTVADHPVAECRI